MNIYRTLFAVGLVLLAAISGTAAASAQAVRTTRSAGGGTPHRRLQVFDFGLGKLRTVPVEKTEFVKATEYVTRDQVKQEVHYRPAITTGTLVIKRPRVVMKTDVVNVPHVIFDTKTVVEERKLLRPRLTNMARVFSQPNVVLTHHEGLGKGPNLEADLVTKPRVLVLPSVDAQVERVPVTRVVSKPILTTQQLTINRPVVVLEDEIVQLPRLAIEKTVVEKTVSVADKILVDKPVKVTTYQKLPAPAPVPSEPIFLDHHLLFGHGRGGQQGSPLASSGIPAPAMGDVWSDDSGAQFIADGVGQILDGVSGDGISGGTIVGGTIVGDSDAGSFVPASGNALAVGALAGMGGAFGAPSSAAAMGSRYAPLAPPTSGILPARSRATAPLSSGADWSVAYPAVPAASAAHVAGGGSRWAGGGATSSSFIGSSSGSGFSGTGGGADDDDGGIVLGPDTQLIGPDGRPIDVASLRAGDALPPGTIVRGGGRNTVLGASSGSGGGMPSNGMPSGGIATGGMPSGGIASGSGRLVSAGSLMMTPERGGPRQLW